MKRNKKWQNIEIELLKRYPYIKVHKLARILKRSKSSIKGKLVVLGMYGKSKNSEYKLGENIKLCRCGCGGWITFKGYNFYKRLRDYIPGHNPSDIGNFIRKTREFRKTDAYRKEKSEIYKKYWADENFRNKRLKQIMDGWKMKPNKPEKILKEIIEKNNLPFNYVGNGAIWFTGENHSFNPDFLSKNPKHIIEVFGDYWHNTSKNKLKDIERLTTYLKYGYKTLVIWEHELVNNSYSRRFGKNLSEQEIIDKIKNFIIIKC